MSGKIFTLPRFRGANLAFLKNHDHEVIVCGGADIGKTWAGCVKSFMLCADKNRKGVHGCMVRKTFNSISESGARTFNTITRDMPIKRLGGSSYTDKWIFPNGSELVAVGMDKPDKLLSSEWDFVQVVQSEQLLESDWETIGSRCTGRGAVVAYPQIFGDCNPAGSRHWIRERSKAGKLTLLNAAHKDNPSLYDDAGNILPEGTKRLGILDSTLTGVRRKRLLEGQWASVEGAVYDTWDATIGGLHIRERSPNEMKRWLLCVDEGYTNPCAIGLVGIDGDGRWHLFKEWYKSHQLEQAVVAQVKEWFTVPVPNSRCEYAAVDDAAAGLVAALNNSGVLARGAKGRINDGINAIQNRLAKCGDGKARLTVDPSCVNTLGEFESYVWETDKPKDVPVDADNHMLGAIRYLAHAEGEATGMITSSADVSAPSIGSGMFNNTDNLVEIAGDFFAP